MLSWLKRKNDSETVNLLRELHQKMDFRFSEISAQIKELELGLNQMETRLLTKDLKDKQAYGLLHYKLHEVKSNKLNEEIETLEKALSSKKLPLKDH
ncbi:MAG: hypothetical protein ACJ76H_01215 [Bacteriovoracaceae bacterium]